MPSERLLHFFATLPCDDSAATFRPLLADSVVGHGSRVQPIPIERVMDGMRLGSCLTSQRLAPTALSVAAVILRRDALDAQSFERDAELPSRATLTRGRVRLDVAAMLCRRWHWAREARQVFRYLAYDASPQKGVEIFATVERVLTVLSNDRFSATSAVDERRLPLVTLGHGRTSLEDKVQAHIHQVWLEYGPGQDTLQRANSAVRQCLSDMGTEFGLADVVDVTPLCTRTGDGDGMNSCLYPLALQVPGPQHLLDTLLKDGLATVPWWSTWEGQAKAACQWLHPKTRRQFLQRRLRGSVAGLASKLNAACERFAVWRWKTLLKVTEDLLRMQEALRSATVGLSSADLVSARHSVVRGFPYGRAV